MPIQTVYERLMGGPLRVTIKNVRQQATLFVKRRADGAECWINETDFDERLHTRLKAPAIKPRVRIPRERLETPEVDMTRQHLGLLTIDELRNLPEFSSLEGRERLLDKESIVTALLVAAGVETPKVNVSQAEREIITEDEEESEDEAESNEEPVQQEAPAKRKRLPRRT